MVSFPLVNCYGFSLWLLAKYLNLNISKFEMFCLNNAAAWNKADKGNRRTWNHKCLKAYRYTSIIIINICINTRNCDQGIMGRIKFTNLKLLYVCSLWFVSYKRSVSYLTSILCLQYFPYEVSLEQKIFTVVNCFKSCNNLFP